MLRHTQECRDRGVPFLADPSQQLTGMDAATIKFLIDGAAYLVVNDYEKGLIEHKTGWTDSDVLTRVGTRVTTHGADGVLIESAAEPPVKVAAVPATEVADPTGVGDAFRAGFIAGLAWSLPLERSAQLGCVLATLALETVGTQEYRVRSADVAARLGAAYGPECAADLARAAPERPSAVRAVRSRSATAAHAVGSRGRRLARQDRQRGCSGRRGAQVVLVAHPAPLWDVQPRGRVVGEHRDHAADGDVGDVASEFDHREGAAAAAHVQDEVCGVRVPRESGTGDGSDRGFVVRTAGAGGGVRSRVGARPNHRDATPACARSRSTAAGNTSSSRATSRSVVSRLSEIRRFPWVSTPIAAST